MDTNNLINLALLFLSPVPSILYFLALQKNYQLQLFIKDDDLNQNFLSWDTLFKIGLYEPLIAINILFFFNICIQFWIVGLIQGSTWLIDPYWTILPPLIGLFFRFHPRANGNQFRVWISTTLLWLWSVRLTHSYFRREEWQLGAREDWRYSDLRKKYGVHWIYVSFFSVYFVQQLMLVGIMLPFWAINFYQVDLNTFDLLATVMCISGLIIAWIADNQLREFMVANEKRKLNGEPVKLLLNTGLWKYSRHPNYFGEQLWWWGVGIYGVSTGQPWTLIGTLFNSAVMVGVTQLTEERMMSRRTRREIYKQYQRSTSVWAPWFQKQSLKKD